MLGLWCPGSQPGPIGLCQGSQEAGLPPSGNLFVGCSGRSTRVL